MLHPMSPPEVLLNDICMVFKTCLVEKHIFLITKVHS